MAETLSRKVPKPALSENPILRYFTFIALYFSQGIPEGITIFAIPAWMAMEGKSAAEIAGYSAIVMIPFSLKILLAPIMERFTYLPMGRRRPWLLFGQFGILCSLIALAFVPNPLDNIHLLALVVLCIHIFIMFQDIATDSLVIDIVPLDQQGKANSLMWGSKTVGSSVALFVGSWIINVHGLADTALAASVFVLCIMFVPLFIRERTGEKLLPWSNGKISPEAALLAVDSWGKLFKSFGRVVLLRNTVLLVISVFITMAAMHFLRTLLPVFTIQELGWDNIQYSRVYSTSNLAGGILGMLIGGIALQRLGIIRTILLVLFLMGTLVLSMAFSMPLWNNSTFVSVFIAFFCTLLTLNNIGVLALAMHLCWKRISAIQFTFCMTIFNAGLATGAALLGYLRSMYEWQILFFIFTGMIVASMLVLRFIKTIRHREQVEILEKNYVAVLQAEGSLLVESETS